MHTIVNTSSATEVVMSKYGNKIEEIHSTSLDGFVVRVSFKSGEQGSISLRHIFDEPKNLSAEILRGGIFEHCFIESGALVWPNGFELCPDALYSWMKEQKSQKVRA